MFQNKFSEANPQPHHSMSPKPHKKITKGVGFQTFWWGEIEKSRLTNYVVLKSISWPGSVTIFSADRLKTLSILALEETGI